MNTDRPGCVKYWTVDEVLSQEIRDRVTREKLALVRDLIRVREPTPEAARRVVAFSRKTGDFPFLSKVDLKLLALAVTFELELNGTKFIRDEPQVR